MHLHIHIHHHNVDEKEIIKKLNSIDMKTSEAVAKLNTVATQLSKVKTEVQKLVDAAQNTDQDIPADLQAAIDSVSAAVQGVDDLNADEAGPTEEPTSPEA